MRAQRIRTGFHRIGIVLVIVCALFGSAAFYEGRYLDVRSAVIFAALLYAFAYGLGWIVAGFVGDAENSN
jgi:hypothetical protein